ncbi:MAG: hypothetical protein ACRENC_10120, partial [Gemmatimonadaceae bacterium]
GESGRQRLRRRVNVPWMRRRRAFVLSHGSIGGRDNIDVGCGPFDNSEQVERSAAEDDDRLWRAARGKQLSHAIESFVNCASAGEIHESAYRDEIHNVSTQKLL